MHYQIGFILLEKDNYVSYQVGEQFCKLSIKKKVQRAESGRICKQQLHQRSRKKKFDYQILFFL